MQWRNLVNMGVLVVLMAGANAHAQDAAFDTWAETFKAKAIAAGISTKTLEDAFTGLEPDERVVKLDRKQPENKVSLDRYLENTITEARIEKARAMLVEYAKPLEKMHKRYGVQPKYIVALWAIESDFGRQQGNFSVIRSLATLAYEGRRAEFFSKELLAALKILESENMPAAELKGSWAGAMGNCQFMPSTFLNYAVDATGDGHRDIWASTSDSFASIANYLSSIGWKGEEEWGAKVLFPEGFTPDKNSLKQGSTASDWAKRGLKYEDGSEPSGRAMRYAIYPGTPDEGALLVTDNFNVLLQWNRSRYFATAVGMLADAIGE
jgi:membrane-bound lytic murein transglycosylase B